MAYFRSILRKTSSPAQRRFDAHGLRRAERQECDRTRVQRRRAMIGFPVRPISGEPPLERRKQHALPPP